MFDFLEYTEVSFDGLSRDVEVYALSTCGFCKRALKFLNDNQVSHRYIHVDLIDIEIKNKVKEELRKRFGGPVSFPYAVVDKKEVLIGFLELDWKKTLLGA